MASLRNPRIDVLRGLAILAVLLLHFTLSYHLGASPLTRIIPPRALRALLINGNFGVTIFFAVSGYLITSMSEARWGLDRMRPRAFYRMRFARILPCLLMVLALIGLFAALGLPSFTNHARGQDFGPGFMALVMLSVLSFWHNVLMAFHGYFNYAVNIYWSLSVEEVFYLAFPLACLLLRRRRWILLLCAAAVIAGPIYRHLHRQDEILYLYAYPACFDAIALGCAAAIAAPRLRMGGAIGKAAQIAALLLLPLAYLRGIDGHEAFGFSLVALATAVLLAGSREGLTGRVASGRALGWLRWLGRHSYELYLFHILVLGLMRDRIASELGYGAKLPALAAFLAVSALVAWLVARFYSEPLNRRLRAEPENTI